MSDVQGTVLDLPMDRQRELAALEGMDFDQWVEQTKKELSEADEIFDQMRNAKAPPTDDDNAFQARIDSENPRH